MGINLPMAQNNVEVEKPLDLMNSKKYVYFEKLYREGLDLNNFPEIVGNELKFIRQFLRYCDKQGYNKDKTIECIKSTQRFNDEDIIKALQSKVQGKLFPPLMDYCMYFGVALTDTDVKKTDDDLVLEIGNELIDDDEHDILYVSGIKEFVMWNGNYWQIDHESLNLERRISEMCIERGLKIKTPFITEIKNHIKRYANSHYLEWDKNRDYILFKNGIWVISMQTFLPSDKSYLGYRVIEHEYHPVKEIPITYRKFLDNLEWDPMDHVRWLVCLKATIEHAGFDKKKIIVHFGVPNGGKSIITTICEAMFGYNLVDVISYDRLKNQYTFGNSERILALIIDDIQVNKIHNVEYGKTKEISSGKPFSVEKKGVDRRKIYPVFTVHETMNNLYEFPTGTDITSIRERFILFKYFKIQEQDDEFVKKLVDEAPELLNYLLTAALPPITEISKIPLTDSDSYDLDDKDLLLNYWDAETHRYEQLVENMITYDHNAYVTVGEVVDTVYGNCIKNGFRIDKYHFQNKILPDLIGKRGGTIISIQSKNGKNTEFCKHIRCDGAQHIKPQFDANHRDIKDELQRLIKINEDKKEEIVKEEAMMEEQIENATTFEIKYPGG